MAIRPFGKTQAWIPSLRKGQEDDKVETRLDSVSYGSAGSIEGGIWKVGKADIHSITLYSFYSQMNGPSFHSNPLHMSPNGHGTLVFVLRNENVPGNTRLDQLPNDARNQYKEHATILKSPL